MRALGKLAIVEGCWEALYPATPGTCGWEPGRGDRLEPDSLEPP